MQCLSRIAVLALTALVLAACQTTTAGPTPQLAKRFDPALWRPEPFPISTLAAGARVETAVSCQKPRCPMNGLVVLASGPLQGVEAAAFRGDISAATLKESVSRGFKAGAQSRGGFSVVRSISIRRGRGSLWIDMQGDGVGRSGHVGIFIFRMRVNAEGTKALLAIGDNLSDARRIFSQAAGAF